MDKEERIKVIRAHRPLKRGGKTNYHHGDWEKRQEGTLARAERYKALMLAGGTLESIGKAEGLTRERIRQVLLTIGFQSQSSPEMRVTREAQGVMTVAKRTFTGQCAHHRCRKQFTKTYSLKIPPNPVCSHKCSGAMHSKLPKEDVDALFLVTGIERKRLNARIRMRVYLKKHRHTPKYKERVRLANLKQGIKHGWYGVKTRKQCINIYKHRVPQFFEAGKIQKFCTVKCQQHFYAHDPNRKAQTATWNAHSYQNKKHRNATKN